MDLERKDQENRVMKKYLDQLCEEEAEKVKRHLEQQTRLREELNKCNADLLRRKELSKEQERLLEAKVIEFQKEKAVRRWHLFFTRLVLIKRSHSVTDSDF